MTEISGAGTGTTPPVAVPHCPALVYSSFPSAGQSRTNRPEIGAMNLAQAESGIGATVAYIPTLETGRIAGVNEYFVFVSFNGMTMACRPIDLVWYYGPVMAQIIRRAIVQHER